MMIRYIVTHVLLSGCEKYPKEIVNIEDRCRFCEYFVGFAFDEITCTVDEKCSEL